MYHPKPSPGISRPTSKSKPLFPEPTFSSGNRHDTPQWNVEDLRLPSPGSNSSTTMNTSQRITTGSHVNTNAMSNTSSTHKSSNRVYPPARDSDDVNKTRHEASTRPFNEVNNARKKWENGETNRGHFFMNNNKSAVRRDEVPDELLARTRMQNTKKHNSQTMPKRNTSKTRNLSSGQEGPKSNKGTLHDTPWSKVRETPVHTGSVNTSPAETKSPIVDVIEPREAFQGDGSNKAQHSPLTLLSVYLQFKKSSFESLITMVAEQYPSIIHTPNYESNTQSMASNQPVLTKPYAARGPNKGYEEGQSSNATHDDKSRNIDMLKANFTEFVHRSHKRYVSEGNRASPQWTGSRHEGKPHYSPRVSGGDFADESNIRAPENNQIGSEGNFRGESCIPGDFGSAESRDAKDCFRHPLSCDPFSEPRHPEFRNRAKLKQDNTLPGLGCYIDSSLIDESGGVIPKDMPWNEIKHPNMFPIGKVDNSTLPQHPMVDNATKKGFYNVMENRNRLPDGKPDESFYHMNEKHDHIFSQGDKMFLNTLKHENQTFDNANAFNDPRLPFLEHMLNAVYQQTERAAPAPAAINEPKQRYPEDLLSQFQSNERAYLDPLINSLGASRIDGKGRNDVFTPEPAHSRKACNRGFNPLEKVWYYKDPSGIEHGPFSSKEMREWWKCNYFSLELRMRLESDAPWLPFALLFPPGGPEPFTFFPSLEQLQRRLQHLLLEDGVQLLNASKEKAPHVPANPINRWNIEKPSVDVSSVKQDEDIWAAKNVSETIRQMPESIPTPVAPQKVSPQEQPSQPRPAMPQEKGPSGAASSVREPVQTNKEVASTKQTEKQPPTEEKRQDNKKKREKANKNEAKGVEKSLNEDTTKPQQPAKEVKVQPVAKGAEKSKGNKMNAQTVEHVDESTEPWHQIKSGKSASKPASKPVVESNQTAVPPVVEERSKSHVSPPSTHDDEHLNNAKGAQPTVIAPWVNAVVRSSPSSLRDVMAAQQEEQSRQMDEKRRQEEERQKEFAYMKARARSAGWNNSAAEEENKNKAENVAQGEFPELGYASSGSLTEQYSKEDVNAAPKGKHSRGSTQSLLEFLSTQAKSSTPVVHSAWATGALQATLTSQNNNTGVLSGATPNTAAPAIVGKKPEPKETPSSNNPGRLSPRMPDSDSIPPSQIEEWKQLLESCSLNLDIPIIEYLATLPTPDEVEEFLQEDFPDHRHLRLFAENFALINCKYAQQTENDRSNNAGSVARSSKPKTKKKKNQGRTLDPSMLGFSVKSRGIGGSLD